MERILRGMFVTLVVVFAVGCAPDPTLDVVEGYETINGHYDVEILEVENTCTGMEDPLDHVFEMRVLVQEERDDGSYVADMFVGGLEWYDVEVAPDGTFEGLVDWWGFELDTISGTVAPNEDGVSVIDATISLEMVGWCASLYTFRGWQLYEPNEPPDSF